MKSRARDQSNRVLRSLRHSGATRSVEPGIHLTAEQVDEWIPGSCFARPGMTREIGRAASHTRHAQTARRANLSQPDGCCLSPQIRTIIRASRTYKRGGSRSSRTLGAGCDGRDSVARNSLRRRTMLSRTEKSCGSDAPTLASSWWYDPLMMVAKEPGHQGEHEGPR
jgi:hypothetical protein